jgi:hypothetical protein
LTRRGAQDFDSHPTVVAIRELLRTAPPPLPANAQEGRFTFDQDGLACYVHAPTEGEEYLLAKPQKETSRWIEITGLHAKISGATADGKSLKSVFYSLSEPVRVLEAWRRELPLNDEQLGQLKEMWDSLWLRLKCATMQAKWGSNFVQAFKKGRLEGEDKEEAAAIAKGCKMDKEQQQTNSAKKQKKGGSGGGGGGSGSGNFSGKKCHNCGGSSHLAKDCPKPKAPYSSSSSKK